MHTHEEVKREQERVAYAMITTYYIYEATTFWVRSGFFVTIQVAIFGIVLASISSYTTHEPSLLSLAPIGLSSFLGIAIAVVWWCMYSRGKRAVHHWFGQLSRIEREALPEKLWNFDRQKIPDFGIRRLVRPLIICFLVLYLGILTFTMSKMAKQPATDNISVQPRIAVPSVDFSSSKLRGHDSKSNSKNLPTLSREQLAH